MSEGVKNDGDKPRYDLYPAEALAGTVRILTFGAKKYADRNWEQGMKYGRVFGALQRHMWAWWGGQDNDPETGECHLHHAACCIAFLQTFVERGRVELDDRPLDRMAAAPPHDEPRGWGLPGYAMREPR